MFDFMTKYTSEVVISGFLGMKVLKETVNGFSFA